LLQCQLVCPNQSGIRLAGGSAFNAVPDTVTFGGHGQDAVARQLDQLGFAYSLTPAGIVVHGRAAHAMEPENGINAVVRLCRALDAAGLGSNAIRFVSRVLGEDPHGIRIFGPCADGPSGSLRINVGKIELAETERLSIDCRIPVTVAKEVVVERLVAAAAQEGLAFEEFDWLAPLYLPLDHFVIRTLMGVYGRASGDTASPPMSSGGATYARAMANCVAFGALMPGEANTEHGANERAVLDNLYKAMEIYAHSVYELAR
jgi:acetylornithine deacetylase/succinyl-diaminopimelate desuccinylase-like protein